MGSVDIYRVGCEHADARRLIDEVQREYVARYGEADRATVDPWEFAPPHGAFFVGYVAGCPAVSGGWRIRDPRDRGSGSAALGSTTVDDAEFKRMYTVAWARGRGFARAMLTELERTAARAGCARAILETGARQPEAFALYVSAGYVEIEPFGAYRDDPETIFFGKELAVVARESR